MLYFHGLYSKVGSQSQIYSIFCTLQLVTLMRYIYFLILFSFILTSCSEEPKEQKVDEYSPASSTSPSSLKKGCKSCHSMTLDKNHSFDCSVCHAGSNNFASAESAHENLISSPSPPDNMMKSCGKCHPKQIENASHSAHFTLKNKVNALRTAFGAKTSIESLMDVPITDLIQKPLDLADDLLRRRCLRCHPFFSGDRYPAVVRGTGCASCHLEFYEGKLVSHSFFKTPGDDNCLQCHYGNWVGADYYGRYEHDMNDEYRTPYTTRYDYFRPFGMEFHQLSADIHQQKGMICVDCHDGKELMAEGNSKISCEDCHSQEKMIRQIPLENISLTDKKDTYTLLSAGDGKQHVIPFTKHPAHIKYGKKVNCQVCHAQWSFNDKGTHLMRNDLDEYDDFERLSVQGSFEVEHIITNNLDFDKEEMDHSMTDKILGDSKTGLWYKGYETRRWETVPIGRDNEGRLQVMRPLLDISLSWVDEDGTVQFDSIKSKAPNNGYTPYVPHTTGKAGLFYRDRIENFLKLERTSNQ